MDFEAPLEPGTVDLVLANTAVYWFTRTAGSSSQLYWERRTFDDAFTDSSFTIDENLPLSGNDYAFRAIDDGRTRATFTSTFATAEALQHVLDMGVVEGATGSINQIDDFLAR